MATGSLPITTTITSLDVTVTTARVQNAETGGAVLWVNVDYYDITGTVRSLEPVKIKDPPIAQGEVMRRTVDMSAVQAVAIRSMALSITGSRPGGENDGFIPSSVNVVANYNDPNCPQQTIVDANGRDFPRGGGMWPTPSQNSNWLDGNEGGVRSKVFFDNPNPPTGVTVVFTDDPFLDVYLLRPFAVPYPAPGKDKSKRSCQVWLVNKSSKTPVLGAADQNGLIKVALWTNDVPEMAHHDTYPSQDEVAYLAFGAQLDPGKSTTPKLCDFGIQNDASTQTEPEANKNVTISLFPIYAVRYRPDDLDINHELTSGVSMGASNAPGEASTSSVFNDGILGISLSRSPAIAWSTSGDRPLATYTVNINKLSAVPVQKLTVTVDTDFNPATGSTSQTVYWRPVNRQLNCVQTTFPQPDICTKTYPDLGWGRWSDYFSVGWVAEPVLSFRNPEQQLVAYYGFTISYSVNYSSVNAPDDVYANWTTPVPAAGVDP